MADYPDLPSTGYERDSKPKEKTSQEMDDEILRIARLRFQLASDYESANRQEGLDDLRFMVSDQWDPSIRAQRENRYRPCLTINKLPTFVHQVTNDQRQNRPSINISPLGSESHKKTAQMLMGYIRAIERDCSADIAYDTGFEGAAKNGWGYWRIVNEYEPWKPGDPFNCQRVAVKRIRNPFTVYRDPARQMPTGEDSMWDFISEWIDRDEFEAKYPKADPCDWLAVGVGDDENNNWIERDRVRIAEYFVVEVQKKTLVSLASGHIGYFDDLDDSIKQRILDDPTFLVEKREADVRRICWYKITAKEILDRRILPGFCNPIIECVGDETDVEGKVVKSGIIRNAKGPQQMYNYSSTAIIEVMALQPKSPYMVAEGQIEDYKGMWDSANLDNYPYLIYKPTTVEDKLNPPPRREPPPQLSNGWIQMQMQSEQDMMGVTGIRFSATQQERTADESGVALQRLNLHQQLGSFHYIDNYSRAMKLTGRLFLDWIPAINDTKKKVTIISEDGKEKVVLLDPYAPASYQMSKDEQGKPIEVYNLNKGKFDVAVTIGPNYATKRQESAKSMIDFMKFLQPPQAMLVPDLIAKNMEWAGSDEISRRLATSLPPGTIQPDASDIDPQVQAVMTQQQRQIQQQQQQLQALSAALEDKKTDQAIQADKINKDFEWHMATVQQKVTDTLIQTMTQRDESLLAHIRELVINESKLASQEKVAAMKPNGAAE